MGSNNQDESAKSIGNRETDSYTENTIYNKSRLIEEHMHAQSKVYPTLADGVTITGDGSAWTLGSITEIIPASTITNYFDIHWIILESASADDKYELVLYKGAALSEIEIARVRFVKTTVAGNGVISIPVMTEIQSSNERISAAVASKSGGDNVVISLGYHEY